MRPAAGRILPLPVLALFLAACAAAGEPDAPAPRAATGEVATPQPVPSYEIPEIEFTRYVLDNGLTLIVHEDHKAPIVAVNLWYHVGSKNEPEGRTGFAHLFEHLMFNGSEHYNDDYFQVMERLGATDLNGTTNNDRTNYFQNVPTSALDVALWMESDRMGHLLGAIDQAKLDEQRGVVQNEKRQGENQPYGRVFNLIQEAVYPEGHPYAHSVIGSMEDLDAAELDDVHEWFRTYYGPNNATLVVAGDITPEAAREKVERFFGAIPPSPPIEKDETWVAPMEGERRQVMQDRVPEARVYKVWNIPAWGTEAMAQLDLASDVLARGKNSRLYRRLVYEDQTATTVSAFVFDKEIGGNFIVMASVKPGEDLDVVESAVDEELARFLDEGPTAAELERVRSASHASFLRGIERIGGFGGKSDVLAESEVYGGSPDHYLQYRRWIMEASPSTVHEAATTWLSDGVFVLEVHPFADLAAAGADVDRSAVPDAGTPPAPSFPSIQRATLPNGLDLILAERHALPIVSLSLMVDAGYAADQHHDLGVADLALDMLDEGTDTRSALDIDDESLRLGASISTGSALDASFVNLSALKENLDASLELWADVILDPAFPEAEFQRLQQQQLAAIQREKSSPVSMALRVFPVMLYGEGHPYGIPFTGSGTTESVEAMTRSQLQAFHETWFRPGNATVIAVGDITLEELQPRLEALFSDWEGGEVPSKDVARAPEGADGGVVYIMDRPDAQQSVIIAGHAFPPPSEGNEFASDAANRILGGSFTSRVNMNLREDKHWSYGAQTIVLDARGPRPFVAFAPVQTDRTRESMEELRSEFQGITGDRPATEDELVKVKDGQVLTLPGRWETVDAIAGSLTEQVNLGLPDDYWQSYADHVRALRLGDVQETARTRIHPDRIIWVVVGDRAAIEEPIREGGFGEIHLIDAEGDVITDTVAPDDEP
jgi:zinc protease